MISLFDDYYHIKSACSLSDNLANNRFLPRAISCLLGESVQNTRVASLFFSVLLVTLLFKLFFNKEEKSNIRFYKFLILLINPFTLYPLINASQLSSIMMYTLSFLLLYFFIHYHHKKKSIINWALATSILFVGSLTRFEFIHCYIIICFFYYLYKVDFKPKLLKKLIDKNFYIIQSLYILIFFTLKLCYVKLASKKTMGYILPNIDSISFQTYPKLDYYLSQPLAFIIYLKNLIFPFSLTYYDNWHLWHQVKNSALLLSLSIIFITFFICTSIYTFASKKKNLTSCLAKSLFIFISITIIFSAFMRVSWYYPARQILGSIIFISILLGQIKNEKKLQLILLYTLTSFSYLIIYPFNSYENLYAHEKIFSSQLHPVLIQRRADDYYKNGDYDKSLYGYETIRKSLTENDIYLKSSRAAVFWSLAVYGSYASLIKLKNHAMAQKYMLQLMRGTYFVTTHACLQDDNISLEACLTAQRIENYCKMYLMKALPSMIQVKAYRKSPELFCK